MVCKASLVLALVQTCTFAFDSNWDQAEQKSELKTLVFKYCISYWDVNVSIEAAQINNSGKSGQTCHIT